MSKPKTDIVVQLTGTDGNIFCLTGKVSTALRRGGFPELAEKLMEEVTQCGSYDEALCKLADYVIVK